MRSQGVFLWRPWWSLLGYIPETNSQGGGQKKKQRRGALRHWSVPFNSSILFGGVDRGRYRLRGRGAVIPLVVSCLTWVEDRAQKKKKGERGELFKAEGWGEGATCVVRHARHCYLCLVHRLFQAAKNHSWAQDTNTPLDNFDIKANSCKNPHSAGSRLLALHGCPPAKYAH